MTVILILWLTVDLFRDLDLLDHDYFKFMISVRAGCGQTCPQRLLDLGPQ